MSKTIVEGDYEWDPVKERANRRDHRVSFAEAATALAHPDVAVFDDGGGQGRCKAIGFSRRGRLLAVIFVERGNRERIISARAATMEEHVLYKDVWR